MLTSISSGPRDLGSQPGHTLVCCVTLGPFPDLFKPWCSHRENGHWKQSPSHGVLAGCVTHASSELGAGGMSWLASREKNGLFPTPFSI